MDTQQQKSYKVLIIGDSCKDVYVYGECHRLSPEAPVPVLRKIKKEYFTGMANNVADNVKNIIGNVTFLHNKESIKKIRFVDQKSKQQLMRYDIEPSYIKPLDAKCIDYDNNWDALIISDYDKGYLNRENLSHVLANINCPVFVDSKKRDLSIFENCILKINEKEYAEAVNLPKNCEIIVTLGSKGSKFIKDKKQVYYSARSVDVFDVSGAGDVFIASLVCRYLETKNIDTSIKTANNCASLSVTKSGTYKITRREDEELCI